MRGLMQDWPLIISRIAQHAEHFHPGVEIVTQTIEAGRHRYTYADFALRARKLSQGLIRLGVKKGDPVGTLAWNTYRHLELYYGVPGMGGICHTLNPRLFPKQIAWVINHAEDKALFFDLTFLPLVQGLEEHLSTVKHFVVLAAREHMPKSLPPYYLSYEELLEGEDGSYEWATVDENDAAALCYTSGTTGDPKGVLYSHRSTVLHAMGIIAHDSFDLRSEKTIMPVVPMFHANAWGYPFGGFLTGCKFVFNGPFFDGKTLHTLIKEEEVHTITGVPTIWLGLLQYIQENNLDIASLTGVGIGGSAAPLSMIKAFEDLGADVHHAWGMTEMSPVGTVGTMTGKTAKWSKEDQLKLKTKQGRGIFGVEMKIVVDDGSEAPWDGKTFGHLHVRGPWIINQYFKASSPVTDKDGWFDTEDIATIDENGYLQITDRAKDVIKSGGEWISSIALENAAAGHGGIALAAVIGLPHPKWRERPLLIVALQEGKELDKKEVIDHLKGEVAEWWLPNDIVTIEEMPLSATGKIKKTVLREIFKDHQWPSDD